MKRKLLVILTAVVMMMSASLTVLAQPSAEGSAAISIINVIDKSGKALDSQSCHEIRVQNLTGEQLQLAKDIVKPENLKKVLSEEDAKKNWTSFEFDAFLYDILEKKEVEWTDGDYHFPVNITFKVPGVTSKSNVKVLHYYPNSWHKENIVKVGTNEVTVQFTHLSPIVIMVDNPASTGTGTVTSPQTGESNIILYGVLMACIALTGAVVVKRKTNA